MVRYAEIIISIKLSVTMKISSEKKRLYLIFAYLDGNLFLNGTSMVTKNKTLITYMLRKNEIDPKFRRLHWFS